MAQCAALGMTAIHSRNVAAADEGIRLDVFLANQAEVGARPLARQLVESGAVRVSGVGGRLKPGYFLTAGQVVEFAVDPQPTWDPLAPDLPLPEVRVLYEDPWLVAIDKPAGLTVHPPSDKSFRDHTVASWAKARFGELPSPIAADRPGIVHRLDRETSGVMVLARTEAAFDHLRAQWQARAVEKVYRAIVFGEPRFQSDWIEKAIAPDPAKPDRMTVVDEGGRESSTYYEVVERFDGFAHVLCKPRTGRTHQIRVHMTAIGHSLVGDKLYRSRSRQHAQLPPGAPPVRRHCLHAERLTLPHPSTGEPIEFEAPLPDDLRDLLVWLRQHRPSAS